MPCDIAELRTGIEAVVSRVNGHDDVEMFDITTPTWKAMNSGFPQADIMNQIATVVKTL